MTIDPIAFEYCSLRFAHGGWTEANAAARDKFGERAAIFECFAALGDSGWSGRRKPAEAPGRPAPSVRGAGRLHGL